MQDITILVRELLLLLLPAGGGARRRRAAAAERVSLQGGSDCTKLTASYAVIHTRYRVDIVMTCHTYLCRALIG